MLRKAAVKRRTRWLILSATLLVVVAIGLAAVSTRLWISPERVRQRVVAVLEERLDGEVELGQLSLRLFPAVRVEAEGLVVRHEGRRDVPPLVSVKRIIVDGNLIDFWRRRVRRVTLDSLDIHIAPARRDQPAVKSQPVEVERPLQQAKSRYVRRSAGCGD